MQDDEAERINRLWNMVCVETPHRRRCQVCVWMDDDGLESGCTRYIHDDRYDPDDCPECIECDIEAAWEAAEERGHDAWAIYILARHGLPTGWKIVDRRITVREAISRRWYLIGWRLPYCGPWCGPYTPRGG